jgi:hypothetical protein
MEHEVTNLQETPSLSLTDKGYLKEAAKWGKFLAILGFILTGLLVITAFSIGAIMKSIPLPIGGNPFLQTGAFAYVFTAIYLLLALFYFFPTLYLFKFSSKMLSGITLDNNEDVTQGFSNLKSMFKFWGVFSIIMLSIYALILLIVILVAVMR